jgi:hypothetical protein
LLNDFFFLHGFTEFSLQINLDSLVEGLVDLLHVVDLILELLDLIEGVLVD